MYHFSKNRPPKNILSKSPPTPIFDTRYDLDNKYTV